MAKEFEALVVKVFKAGHIWSNSTRVFPENFRGSALVVENGTVKDILVGHTPHCSFSEVHQWEDSLIVPGFTNAHTHLELSFMRGKAPFRGSLIHWLLWVGMRRGIKSRRGLEESVALGLSESLRSGTTLLSETFTSDFTLSSLGRSPVSIRAFLEVMGMRPLEASETFEGVLGRLERLPETSLLGLAPHAPYSCSERLIQLCYETGLPISIHVVEDPEELEFLEMGTGPIARLLKTTRILPKSWEPPRLSGVEFLARLGVLSSRTILVHANYVTENDADLIANSGASVVFCPRSHRFFCHKRYPLKMFLTRGVNVALGTDSLASNWSLSILEEMRFVKENYPETQPSVILKMATESGAQALGLSQTKGRLTPGSSADFAVLTPPDPDASPWSALFDSRTKVAATIIGGKLYNFN